MDNDNIKELYALKPCDKCRAKIELLGSYDPNKEIIIRDPYHVCYIYIFILNLHYIYMIFISNLYIYIFI